MKRVGTILISVMLAICMAIGLTACGDKSGNGGNNGGNNGGGNETPATPTVTCDVNNLLLVKNEKVNVTATVANSEKAASFSLAANDESVVALKVSESTPNVATIEAIADGTATLTVALEGATSVTVPITVDGMVGITGDILDQTKVLDAGTTGQDDGETSALQVRHYMGDDYKLEVTNANENVAALTGEAGAYSVKAKQAGVSEITVTLLGVKEEQKPQEPEEGVEPTEEVEPEQPEQPEEPVYEEVFKKTISVVCTDDWDKAAKEDEVSSKLLSFKEVTGGYAAHIDRANADENVLFDLEEQGVLRVPAVYNRKPVVSVVGNQENLGTGYFLAFNNKPNTTDLEGKPTPEEIEAIEDEQEKAQAQAKADAFDEYQDIYELIDEVYLPCTLTEIPALAFRRAVVSKVEVQKGNHIATIGTQAVNESVNLVSFNLEDCRELKVIAHNAFTNNGNASLSLIVPNSVEVVEHSAFGMSNLDKLEFEAAKKVDGKYAPSITLQVGDPTDANLEGTFAGANIKTLAIRNVKAVSGGDSLVQTATLGRLVIGEDIGTTIHELSKTTISVLCFNDNGWGLSLVFKATDSAEVLFEGADNWMPNNANTFAGVDNCGGLFSDFWATAGFISAKKLYIHKDANVTAWLQNLYEQQGAGTEELSDYNIWTRK